MFSLRNPSSLKSAFKFRLHAPQLGWNLFILALWFWLYRGMFDYLGVVALREDFRTNQLILVGIFALVIWQLRSGQFQIEFHAAPRPYPVPLGLALGGSVIYLVSERTLDINTLSATLFGLATCGLLGLWMSPRSWRAGLPAALLLIGVLPFGEHLQTFIGYPLRFLTAELVRDALAAFQIGSTGVDTILVLENGVSQVDLPCSGIKSLWTGALFFLAVTWLERRALNLRWLIVAGLFVLLLFCANLVRVAALVVTAQVLNMPVAAEMLHVPLGVLGFVGACATAVVLLRRKNPNSSNFPAPEPLHSTSPSLNPSITQPPLHRALSPLLAVALVAMALVYAPRPETGLQRQAPAWNFPAELHTEPLPLKPDEIEWLTRDGAESATRLRFTWQGISGSMILVPSQTWRAHHRPERCFEVFGLQMEDSRAQLVANEFPIRAVTLRDPQSRVGLSAAYWFQSVNRVTDDYGTRIWADTVAPAERWVLVSILFDGHIESADTRVNALYHALRRAIREQLQRNSKMVKQ